MQLLKQHAKKPTCAVGMLATTLSDPVSDVTKMACIHTATGDGGNDVSMIQAADVGVGIVGKACCDMITLEIIIQQRLDHTVNSILQH